MSWLDPLRGPGYQFWSGIGATLAPFVVGALLWAMPTRCHELGCRRRARKASVTNGQYYCDRHVPPEPGAE